MTQSDTLRYTGKVRTVGGRDRTSRSSEGRLAAGWSACFEDALALAARALKITPPINPVIDAEVHLNMGDDGYFLRARLSVHLPGV